MVVIVDVLCSYDTTIFCHRQLLIVQQFHLSKLNHVGHDVVALLEDIRVIVDAFQ